MSAKEKKRRKRERKWHIRWVGDQLAVFPLCVLYVLYMCREREIEEGKKKIYQECQRHIIVTSSFLELMERDLRSLFSSQCSFIAVC